MSFWGGVKKGLRKHPFLGHLVPDEKVDQNTIDVGKQYYDAPAANAASLYGDAMGRSNASYQAGDIRDVDLSQGNALQGRQMGGLDMQQAQVNGPSTAGAQYAAAMGQQRNAALGVVAGSRGAGRGAGRLNVAGQMGANAGINAQQQAAAVGMERQNAINSYTQALQGARGQDMTQANNQAGMQLQRDVSADAAGQGAFNATHNAQQGYLNTAGGAVGQQAGIAGGQASAVQEQYALARAEEDRRARKDAADREAGRKMVGDFVGMAAGKPPGM